MKFSGWDLSMALYEAYCLMQIRMGTMNLVRDVCHLKNGRLHTEKCTHLGSRPLSILTLNLRHQWVHHVNLEDTKVTGL